MPQEIERKFLVASDGWREGADQGRLFRQAYLAATGRLSIRVRIEDGARALLTLKTAKVGFSRGEFEYAVPLEDAEALARLCMGIELRKTRFCTPYGGRIWEIDIYDGENSGLVIAEVELESETETVDLPPWVGREVTHERRYYAANLATRPYHSWADDADAGA